MTDVDKEKAAAVFKLLERSGAIGLQIRFDDSDEPYLWVAVAMYRKDRWEVAAGHTAVEALERLCERLLDGGKCTHCNRPSGFDPHENGVGPIDQLVCFYRWNPERSEYVRGCEGVAP
jgi:hypothetical protein